MSDLKGVPKRVAITEDLNAYPSDLVNYADLIIREGQVVKDRHGVCREATPDEIESCKELTPAEAKALLDESAWRGQPPAEGTRRRIVLDAISKGDVLSDTEALEIADTVESALLRSGDDEREADAQEAISAVGDALDRIDAPQGATYAERIDRLYSEGREIRREAIAAGNEFDRISIPRSTGATGEPGTPRTLTLAERAAICIRRVLTEEEAKRLLASTIDAQAKLRDNPHLPAEYRERLEGALGIPPEGSRARLIYDTLLHEKVLLADGVAREHTLLDRVSVARLAAVLEAVLNESALAQVADPGRRVEGKVPSGTRELHVVLADNTADSPQMLFVELENERGASVGSFEQRREGEYTRIVIPYGRDDAWVSEVAYQVAGAATRPLLEDHPDYVFPSERVRDAVAELLSDFGIPRACTDCAEEQIGHGAKEVDGRRDATIKQLELDVERFLGEREEARAGESRFAEERDCAFALLRWLLPVTVAKRLD